MTAAINKRFVTDQERWQAIAGREQQADGRFVYSVVTTGVYCRPACPSRLPNRANVRFFDTWEEAERAGFRPCKRCNPHAPDRQEPHVKAILRACKIIETSEVSPSLQELAEKVGLSASHFHRLFKKMVGVTPKQYASARRLNRVQDRLQQDATVTEAMYNAGFNASSRFYENGTAGLGMKPSEYREGASGRQIRFALAQSYLGWVLVAATRQGICAIDLGDTPDALEERLRARFPKAEFRHDDPDFAAWVAQVIAFIEAPGHGLDLPLDVQGTAFQQRVWLALREVPAGSTTNYADVAARIGKPKAVQAVAQACASNTIAVAIPCHRVVRRDGSLGGYRWGIERKRALLEREASIKS